MAGDGNENTLHLWSVQHPRLELSATPAPRTLVIVPMYNCAPQITRVLAQFHTAPACQVARVLVVDNRSTDDGLQVATRALAAMTAPEVLLVRNRENYGLGGSHKVGFRHAIAHGFDRAVILHGDDQGTIEDLLPTLARAPQRDAWLGARFMPGSQLHGYSTLRSLGNRAFNALFGLVARRRVFDLGSGLNCYDVRILRDGFYRRFPDDLTFNYCMILAHIALRHDITFVPIRWREDDQVSNVRLTRQALKVLRLLSHFAGGATAFLQREWRATPRDAYECELIAANYPAAV